MSSSTLPMPLVGDGELVPCVDGVARPYLNLDAAASTSALPAVARRAMEFLPAYASVHRGAGYRSRQATAAYERARLSALAFAGRGDRDGDVAIFCRNTTEAINHLAYRLRLEPRDVVVTTVIEHHANLLPWARLCDRRFVECGVNGTFTADDVTEVLDASPRPKLLAVSGASNVTGWRPPLEEIIEAGEGSIHWNEKRGRFIGHAPRLSDGRRPMVSAKTKTEARDKLRKVMRDRAAGLSAANGHLTVAKFLEQWLADVLPAQPKVKAAETITNAEWAVNKHIVPTLGSKKLADLTADDVDELLQGMAAKGYARNTMMRVRTVLGRALRHAERRGKVLRNVVALVDTPAGPARLQRSLTVPQAKALLKAARGHRLEALWVTALMLGLRPIELRGLRWSDLNLDSATLQVRQGVRRDGTTAERAHDGPSTFLCPS